MTVFHDPSIATRKRSPPGRTATSGSPTAAATRSAHDAGGRRDRLHRPRPRRPRTGSRPGPTATSGSPMHQATLDRADHHRRGRDPLQRPRHRVGPHGSRRALDGNLWFTQPRTATRSGGSRRPGTVDHVHRTRRSTRLTGITMPVPTATSGSPTRAATRSAASPPAGVVSTFTDPTIVVPTRSPPGPTATSGSTTTAPPTAARPRPHRHPDGVGHRASPIPTRPRELARHRPHGPGSATLWFTTAPRLDRSIGTMSVTTPPVAYDFNGDGDADPGVYRAGRGTSTARRTQFLGLASDTPVPADYNGNGTTDLAVFRPSVGGWYITGQRHPVPRPGRRHPRARRLRRQRLGPDRRVPACGRRLVHQRPGHPVPRTVDRRPGPGPLRQRRPRSPRASTGRRSVAGTSTARPPSSSASPPTRPCPATTPVPGSPRSACSVPSVGGWYVARPGPSVPRPRRPTCPFAADYIGVGHLARRCSATARGTSPASPPCSSGRPATSRSTSPPRSTPTTRPTTPDRPCGRAAFSANELDQVRKPSA